MSILRRRAIAIADTVNKLLLVGGVLTGLVTLAMVLTQVSLPFEGIGLIIGVDRLLDMS